MKKKVIISVLVAVFTLAVLLYSYFVVDFFEMQFDGDKYISVNRLGIARYSPHARDEITEYENEYPWSWMGRVTKVHNPEETIVKKLSKQQHKEFKEILNTFDLKKGNAKEVASISVYSYWFMMSIRINSNAYASHFFDLEDLEPPREHSHGMISFFTEEFDIDVNEYIPLSVRNRGKT